MNKLKFALITCIGMVLITSCDPEDPVTTICDTADMTYTDDVKSIFDESCAFSGCHDDNATMTIGSLSTYDNAVAFVGFGRILGAINRDEGFSDMPAGGASKLDDCTIDKITNWVNNGTPE